MEELVEEWLEVLTSGGEIGDIYELMIRSKTQSLALQHVFDRLPQKDPHNGRRIQENLVLGLHGRVCDAIESDHGNHVLQKSIEVLPQKLSTFIIDELLGR